MQSVSRLMNRQPYCDSRRLRQTTMPKQTQWIWMNYETGSMKLYQPRSWGLVQQNMNILIPIRWCFSIFQSWRQLKKQHVSVLNGCHDFSYGFWVFVCELGTINTHATRSFSTESQRWYTTDTGYLKNLHNQCIVVPNIFCIECNL